MNSHNKVKYLYIHWPFCNKKCFYCDFISFEKHEQFTNRYLEALCNEINNFAKTQKSNIAPIKTIFFGGGTPSLCPLPLFEKLYKTISSNFDLTNLAESTIETNPGDVTKKHLETWKKPGINRLSIGVQMLDEQILKTVNRHQKNEDVKKLLNLTPLYFKNISVDLILGLPGTTPERWHQTLEFVVNAPIKHISVYFLTIYEKTPLYFKIKRGEITPISDDLLIDMYEQTIKFLETNNFLQYEISNFAKPGYESIHNRAYWDRKSYRGFGIGAASFDGKKRLVNSNNLLKYLHSPPPKEEILAPEDVFLEKLMLGLRQRKGIDLQRMVYFLSREEYRGLKEKVEYLKKKNFVQEKNGRVSLTIRGMVLENKVLRFIS
jgi:oxygen-independent coproporphyrinogen-3 oxidase